MVDTINPNDSNMGAYYDYPTGLSPLDLNISAGPDNDKLIMGGLLLFQEFFRLAGERGKLGLS